MTTIPTTPATMIAQRVAVPSAPAAPTPSMGAVDPVKIIQKYKWVWLVAAVIGAAIGAAAHFAWMRVYPIWRSAAIFEVFPSPGTTISESMSPGYVNRDEMMAFMQTQARLMISPNVLQAVAEDPDLISYAPKWSAEYRRTDPSTGEERFDSVTAARDLEDYVSARVIPQTNLVQLACSYKDKNEVKGIVQLVREHYMRNLENQRILLREERTKALSNQIARFDQEIRAAQQRRDSIIKEKGLDSTNDRINQRQQALGKINDDLIERQQDLNSARKLQEQLLAERNSPAGPQFGPDLEEQAEKDPVILDIRGRISSLETSYRALLERYGRDHRDVRLVQSQIDASKSNLEDTRLKVMNKLFDGRLEDVNKTIGQFEAQIADLDVRKREIELALVEMTSSQSTVTDLNRQISNLQDDRVEFRSALENVIAVTELQTSNRVILRENERVPTIPAFPKLKAMVPLGSIVTLALVAGILFLREMIDQRVKGPSDIALIPRTRLLGWIPDAGEDPAGPGAFETAFRDRSRGVVAESFRQVRGSLIKRLAGSDHRAVLVLGSMPGSGATSVIVNLGLAHATADKRVLIIDANFRRPAAHRVLGLQASPGLGEVLAGRATLSDATQATSTPGLDLISAGAKELRVVERLSTHAMAELLTRARAEYDLVLVDCAPAIVAGDYLALCQKCDATILIVRANAEKRGMVARVRNELAEARAEFLGVVVNGVRAAAGGYLRGNIKASAEYQEA
ncbi:MAG TPA: AAA family ATPase [Phycisphaerales bacterium]|nr:AAA family ATPase [Phycisphaerales bacterium]